MDKRSKMYKAVKNAGKIVEFSTQTEELITRWVLARLKKEGKNITGSVMQLFLSKTGSDMGNIDRELEKLICYTMDKSVIETADVEAIATEQTTNRIFEMVNAIAEHNQRRALDLYYDLLTLKEPPMRIMYLITRQFQILLHLRDMAGKGFDNQTMAQKAGIPPFAVKRNLTQARGRCGAGGSSKDGTDERSDGGGAVYHPLQCGKAEKIKKGTKKHQYDGTGVFIRLG